MEAEEKSYFYNLPQIKDGIQITFIKSVQFVKSKDIQAIKQKL